MWYFGQNWWSDGCSRGRMLSRASKWGVRMSEQGEGGRLPGGWTDSADESASGYLFLGIKITTYFLTDSFQKHFLKCNRFPDSTRQTLNHLLISSHTLSGKMYFLLCRQTWKTRSLSRPDCGELASWYWKWPFLPIKAIRVAVLALKKIFDVQNASLNVAMGLVSPMVKFQPH